jgi:predicted dehydrogenase
VRAPGIAVVGTDHAHVVELTQQFVASGAEVRAVVATEDGLGPWLASQYEGARREHPYEDDIDIVVTAAVPSERAAIAVRAMHAGKDVVADKAGVTTDAQLDEIRRACADTGRRWLVVFGERLGNPAMREAERLVAGGAIGEVVHTVGLGPHTLDLKHRPHWFFDPERYGGILVDIGSHQVDQFLAFTGSRDADVLAATVRAHDEHPGLQVLGEMLLAVRGQPCTGYARVDYFTPKGLGSWGDVRFTVVGTHGYIEVCSADETLLLVDNDAKREINCRGRPVDWAEQFLQGAMPAPQHHVVAVHDICLRAQGISTTRPTA